MFFFLFFKDLLEGDGWKGLSGTRGKSFRYLEKGRPKGNGFVIQMSIE